MSAEKELTAAASDLNVAPITKRSANKLIPNVCYVIATVLFYFAIKFLFMWKYAARFALVPKLVAFVNIYIGIACILSGSYSQAGDPSIGAKNGYTGTWETKNFILLLPYLAACRLAVFLYRSFATTPVTTKIFDGWYISGWVDTLQHVKDAGSDGKNIAILDMTLELPRVVQNPQVPYYCVPTFDRSTPSLKSITEGVNWALQQRSLGYDVVVHCAYGHGRSATVLIACLLAEGLATDIIEMETEIRSIRPRVRLTVEQLATLTAWTKRVSLPIPNSPFIRASIEKALLEEEEENAKNAENKEDQDDEPKIVEIEDDETPVGKSNDEESKNDKTADDVEPEADVETKANSDDQPEVATSTEVADDEID